jgi:hypothetical protein
MSEFNHLAPIMQGLIQAILFAALLSKVMLLYIVVAKFSPDWQERIMRSIAATCGCSLVLRGTPDGLSWCVATECGRLCLGMVRLLVLQQPEPAQEPGWHANTSSGRCDGGPLKPQHYR